MCPVSVYVYVRRRAWPNKIRSVHVGLPPPCTWHSHAHSSLSPSCWVVKCSEDDRGSKFKKFHVFFKGMEAKFLKAAAEAAVANQVTGLSSRMENAGMGGAAAEVRTYLMFYYACIYVCACMDGWTDGWYVCAVPHYDLNLQFVWLTLVLYDKAAEIEEIKSKLTWTISRHRIGPRVFGLFKTTRACE